MATGFHGILAAGRYPVRKEYTMKKTLWNMTVLTGIAILGVLMISCKKEPPKPAYDDSAKSAVPETMTLVWSDEFDYEGSPDPDKWDYRIGNINGWGNAEIQKYTKNPENVFVKDGVLTITALKNNPKSNNWTSAAVKTQYKAFWDHGFVEVRAKLPEGVGTWPAIWMMPNGDKYGNWPRSGEIDIMEMVGFDLNTIVTTLHTQAFNHKIGTQKTRSAQVFDTVNYYHTYAVDWNKDHMTWYVDGEEFYSVKNEWGDSHNEWPFDIPFYLMMNIAMGGSWGGEKGIDPELSSARMIVDYVRVYQ